MYDHHFSKFCRHPIPNDICKDSATRHSRVWRRGFLKLFYHIWARWPSWSMYDHSYFFRPPVPDNSCKDSATRHPQFWRRRFLKVFTIYGHGSPLGKWTATILANFHSPAPRRLQMKFEQHWPRGSRGEVV